MPPRFLALSLWSAAIALPACTVTGSEVMTTFDPSASGNPPTSGTPNTSSETDQSTSTASGDTSMASGETDDTSDPTTDATSAGETSGGTVDEQPETGMYSECASGVDCIGLTTCVPVAGAMGLGGFCSNTGCVNAVVDCEPVPGVTATAGLACVDNGTGAFVCALDCAGGLTCPGGMACLALGASMVCA